MIEEAGSAGAVEADEISVSALVGWVGLSPLYRRKEREAGELRLTSSSSGGRERVTYEMSDCKQERVIEDWCAEREIGRLVVRRYTSAA